MYKKLIRFLHILCLICISCSGSNNLVREIEPTHQKYKDEFNLEIVCVVDGIADPSQDRRSFYKIYINKNESGRTTTGLESQRKFLKMRLEPNRHLLKIEKWVLDPEMKTYRKLNNIEQPRPAYVYFDLPEGKYMIITAISKVDGHTEYRFSIQD